MKQFYLAFLAAFLSSVSIKCLAQDRWIPKNAISGFAGIEWNTISSLTGVSYERSVLKKDKLTLGVKATYIFSYENGNMEIFSNSYDGHSTIASLMSTLHFFSSNSNQDNEGFFLLFAAGGGSRKHTDEGYTHSRFIYAGELGLGWQFYLGKKTSFGLSTTMKFAGAGGITLMKLSLGF